MLSIDRWGMPIGILYYQLNMHIKYTSKKKALLTRMGRTSQNLKWYHIHIHLDLFGSFVKRNMLADRNKFGFK